MARQLATLLSRSDRDELREILVEWQKQSVTAEQRRVMDQMAGRILDLKAALDAAPVQPTPAELEEALKVMLALAKQQPSG
ncbi:MAG: hypothetical protein IT379_35635 [Deltaproteobacteria bacterium]|nr:hypothetical protein [Deltaproteobacteria bacterium]